MFRPTGDDEMCNFYIMYYGKKGNLPSSNICMTWGPPNWFFQNFKVFIYVLTRISFYLNIIFFELKGIRFDKYARRYKSSAFRKLERITKHARSYEHA